MKVVFCCSTGADSGAGVAEGGAATNGDPVGDD